MIKVNLLEQKVGIQMPVILGLDLNDISVKGLILAIILAYTPDLLFKEHWKEKVRVEKQKIDELEKTLRSYRQKGKKKDVEKTIETFLAEEKRLNERLEVVKKVIKLRKNPWKLLYYTSQHIPNEVWINEIALSNDEIEIKGESSNYKPIGQFLDKLNSSTFFQRGDPRLTGSRTIVNSEFNVRTESFVITGKLARYD